MSHLLIPRFSLPPPGGGAACACRPAPGWPAPPSRSASGGDDGSLFVFGLQIYIIGWWI